MFAGFLPLAAATSLRQTSSGSDSPIAASVPTFRKLRRLTPSQLRWTGPHSIFMADVLPQVRSEK